MITRFLIGALFCALGGMAAAQDKLADPETCLAGAASGNRPVAECVNQAQTACFQFEEASPAATVCFQQAKESWGALIAARMQQIQTGASEEIAAVAGIEVKYDLRGNLMQCDRFEELMLLRQDPGEATLFARSRCEATAVGLAYAKLWLQSQAAK